MLENTQGICSRYQGWGIWFSDHEFWDESISTWSSRFVPSKWPTSVEALTKWSQGRPTRSGHLYALAQEPIYQVLILSSQKRLQN